MEEKFFAPEITEAQLILMAQEGSQTAMEILIRKYMGVVNFVVKNREIKGGDEADLIQEGMIGLFKAVKEYREGSGASFKTFATTCVKNQVLNAIEKASSGKNEALNGAVLLSQKMKEDDDTTIEEMLPESPARGPEEEALFNDFISHLLDAESKTFSERQRKVFALKLRGHDYREIAKILGETPKTVDNDLRQIKKKVLEYIER